MKNSEHYIDAWARRVFDTEIANGLHEIYDTLTDEEKIRFILTGGFQYQQHTQQVRTGSDTQTGQLPVLC